VGKGLDESRSLLSKKDESVTQEKDRCRLVKQRCLFYRFGIFLSRTDLSQQPLGAGYGMLFGVLVPLG
jgi:hypothetical protein